MPFLLHIIRQLGECCKAKVDTLAKLETCNGKRRLGHPVSETGAHLLCLGQNKYNLRICQVSETVMKKEHLRKMDLGDFTSLAAGLRISARHH